MRAPLPALLPIAAATALALAGGEAKAVTIRYSFTNPSNASYTGGTIQVGSLNQLLSVNPVNFTVEVGPDTFNISPNFASATGSSINYQSGSQLWLLQDFDFGASSTTEWKDLLVRTFTPASTSVGKFEWYNTAAPGAPFGIIDASSVTFTEVAVPGPLPALGAAAAFGWSRRLRKRIQAPQQPTARH